MFFSSIFSYFPILLRLYQAGLIKDVDTIVKLEKEVAASQEILFRVCTKQVINAAYDKLYVKTIIPEFPMRLLPPYQTFSEDIVSKYMSEMRKYMPQWFI